MPEPNGRRNHSLTLADAERHTPPVNAIEAMRVQLALALFDGVKPQDMIDLASKLKEQAMKGDLKAARLFMELMLPREAKAAPHPAAEGPGLRLMAEALRDLVDEIRIGKAVRASQLPGQENE